MDGQFVWRLMMEVASFVEAWIEIFTSCKSSHRSKSPPSWRRGLKSSAELIEKVQEVASFVEAWIENIKFLNYEKHLDCRLLRGGVD